jgi:hypothetical protein
MEEAQRQRFLTNIQRETQRIQEMVDRMMELTALETRRVLDNVEPVACWLCWTSWPTPARAWPRNVASASACRPK